MRLPASVGLATAVAIIATVSATVVGCSGIDEPSVGNAGLEPPASQRLARVHIVLQAPDPVPGDDPAFEVRARFVQYRGLEEAAVRSRVDLWPLATDRLRPGQCLPSEVLWSGYEDTADDNRRSDALARELVLVDVGNLAVSLGQAAVDIPLVLVPEVLPYMSGVEYNHISETIPSHAYPASEGLPRNLTIELDGYGDDDLPARSVQVNVPEAVQLSVNAGFDRDSMLLEWRPDGRPAPIVVRLGGYIGSEPVGEELTCLLSDVGSHRFDFDSLRRAGLDLSGDVLQLGASRLARVAFDMGDAFPSDHTEAIVEVRSLSYLHWR